MYTDLLKTLDNGAEIITVNQRLAAFLQGAYAESQHNSTHETPKIHSLNTWLEKTWRDCSPEKRLLSPTITRWMWEKVVNENHSKEFILPTIQVAKQAMDAYHLLCWWGAPIEELSQTMDDDHQQFFEWVQAFEEQLAKHQAISSSQLPEALIKNNLQFTHAIHLVGFQDQPPMIETLFSTLSQAQWAKPLQKNTPIDTIIRTEALNASSEIQAMALWAKNKLAQSDDEPNRRIACVVPDLQSHRQLITNTFKNTFRETNHPMTVEAIHPFNISASRKLIAYPIIHTAIELLSCLLEDSPTVDSLREITGSPYLYSFNAGMDSAALLDEYFRRQNLHTLNLEILEAENQRLLDSHTLKPLLAQLIKHLSITPPSLLYPSEWVDYFLETLETASFPGKQSLNSEEYQLIGQLQSELKKLSTLDDFSNTISYSTCLQQLKNQLHQTTFQPQTDHSSAPVQVLGTLETAGLPFDSLWLMGLDDSRWPPQAKSNPFIPRNIQLLYKLPHRNGEHELDYIKTLQENLIAQSDEVVLSHAIQDGQSKHQASLLTRHYPSIPFARFQSTDNNQYNPSHLELITTSQAPAITAEQRLTGGSAIISNQAACPFRAFSLHRLKAYAIRRAGIGVTAITHGKCLHRALELIWQSLKTQSQLLAQSEAQEVGLIQESVNTALDEASASLPKRYLKIEQQRLENQITEFLALEKERPPFEVLYTERKATIVINQHPLQVIIDRIDKTPSGDCVIIDYKTQAKAAPKKWLLSPPQQGQLPLYAAYILPEETVSGCLYALINRTGAEYTGLGSDTISDAYPNSITEFPKNNSDYGNWSDTITTWKTEFQSLISDFTAGDAAIAPNKNTSPCNYCELKPMCRIEECVE